MLRDQILHGSLAPRSRVGPASLLAREMELPRSEVSDALDRLAAEGYLEPGPGSSCTVADGIRFDTEAAPAAVTPTARTPPFRFDLIDFRPGVPDTSQFPLRLWQRILAEQWRSVSPLDLTYGQPEGSAELRREIARHLSTARSMRCQPEQIIITSGSTQALSVASQLLLRGTRVTCIGEDPGSAETRGVFSGHGARIVGVAVDAQGLVTSALPPTARPAFIHVCPSHQFPTGAAMPIQRRAQLLAYARRHSTFVIEEDFDGDFRYDSPPLSSLQGLCPHRVISVGTFSMTVLPSLRLGYIVAPLALVADLRAAKKRADVQSPAVDQLVLARFIREGFFSRHVEKMRRRYAESRELLVKALDLHFGNEARILGSASGLHLCVRFPGIRFTPTLLNRIDLAGVGVYPVEDLALTKGCWEDALVLGFGTLDSRRINTGIAILKRCLPIA